MIGLYPLEEQVMQSLLEGEDERLQILREQFRVSELKMRNMTGVGFYLHFNVPRDAPRIPGNSDFLIDRHLDAEIEGLSYGAGFILWGKDGAIYQLEGYTVADDWPEQVSKAPFKLNPKLASSLITLRQKKPDDDKN